MSSSWTDRRVVVTGLGVVSPLGSEIDSFWNRLIQSECGIGLISSFDVSNYNCKIAGEVRDFDPTDAFPSPKEVRRTDRFTQFAVKAGYLALKDSGMDLDWRFHWFGDWWVEHDGSAAQSASRKRTFPCFSIHDSHVDPEHGVRAFLDILWSKRT
jgi:hypothetical protein